MKNSCFNRFVLCSVTYSPILVALSLRIFAGASVSYIFVAAFALLGRSQAILGLATSWLITMINPMVIAQGDEGSAGRYLVIFAAAASALLRSGFLNRHLLLRPFTLGTSLLTGFFILHSLLVSPIPDVSILKALSWGLAMTALISLWQGMDLKEFAATTDVLFRGLTLILVTSLPFLALPAGFARNGMGFQGILNHPQAFGVTIALLGVWAGARIFGERRPGWHLIALTAASFTLILFTEARTAGLAMVIGLGLSIFIAPAVTGRGLLRLAPGFSNSRVWVTLAACVAGGVALTATLTDLVVRFLSKSGRASSSNLFEAYEGSRGFLIDAMLANIGSNPFRGVGFGIASHPSAMIVQRDPVFGLPLGAAVEKGVAPLAVLEEVGIFGAVLVALWLFWLLRKGAAGGLAPLAVFLTILVLNMGENTLFSTGGQGLLAMILMGWIYASGEQGKRHI